MKTIIAVVLLTIGFICSMSFIESKRTENLNRINLEYQQSLKDLGKTVSNITISEDDDDNEGNITVNISGAVSNSGEFTLQEGSTLYDLLELVSIKANADSNCYNEDYVLQDNDSIYIPTTNNDNKISINTADESALDLLPGIGPTLATRIVTYREENGNFECIDSIKKVEGIGTSAFNKIKDYIKL